MERKNLVDESKLKPQSEPEQGSGYSWPQPVELVENVGMVGGAVTLGIDVAKYVAVNAPMVHRFIHNAPISQAIRELTDKIF